MNENTRERTPFGPLTATPVGSRDALEKLARAAVDSRVGRTLTDAEWEHARARLIDFVTILCVWEERAQGNGIPASPLEAGLIESGYPDNQNCSTLG